MGAVLPGVIAFLTVGFLTVAALVPWTAREYRRNGQLGFRRFLGAEIGRGRIGNVSTASRVASEP